MLNLKTNKLPTEKPTHPRTVPAVIYDFSFFSHITSAIYLRDLYTENGQTSQCSLSDGRTDVPAVSTPPIARVGSFKVFFEINKIFAFSHRSEFEISGGFYPIDCSYFSRSSQVFKSNSSFYTNSDDFSQSFAISLKIRECYLILFSVCNFGGTASRSRWYLQSILVYSPPPPIPPPAARAVAKKTSIIARTWGLSDPTAPGPPMLPPYFGETLDGAIEESNQLFATFMSLSWVVTLTLKSKCVKVINGHFYALRWTPWSHSVANEKLPYRPHVHSADGEKVLVLAGRRCAVDRPPQPPSGLASEGYCVIKNYVSVAALHTEAVYMCRD